MQGKGRPYRSDQSGLESRQSTRETDRCFCGKISISAYTVPMREATIKARTNCYDTRMERIWECLAKPLSERKAYSHADCNAVLDSWNVELLLYDVVHDARAHAIIETETIDGAPSIV
jgi:hypothetical protein